MLKDKCGVEVKIRDRVAYTYSKEMGIKIGYVVAIGKSFGCESLKIVNEYQVRKGDDVHKQLYFDRSYDTELLEQHIKFYEDNPEHLKGGYQSEFLIINNI